MEVRLAKDYRRGRFLLQSVLILYELHAVNLAISFEPRVSGELVP